MWCISMVICILVAFLFLSTVQGQGSLLDKYFTNCKTSRPDFDSCVRKGLNDARVLFKVGLPELKIEPFDPFYANEVLQVRDGGIISYRLVLRNITESGWARSQVTRFKSNFNKFLIEYTQSFPAKELHGLYNIEGKLFGMNFKNKGKFDLFLYDLIQTTTVARKPIKYVNNTWNYDTKLKVMVNVQTIGNMSLHMTNILGGRPVIEYLIDLIINSTWKTGFPFLRPAINDLVSTAFTEIMNRNFKSFPFDKYFKD